MNCVSCVSLMRMHAHGSMLGLNGEIKHITNKYVLRLMHLLSMFQERRDIAHLKYQSSLNSGNHLGYPIPLIHQIAWVITHEQIHINQQALASTVVHVRRRQPIAHSPLLCVSARKDPNQSGRRRNRVLCMVAHETTVFRTWAAALATLNHAE